MLVARLVHLVAAVLWPLAALAGAWGARRLERERTRRRIYLLVGLGVAIGAHNLVLALTVSRPLRAIHLVTIVVLDAAGIVALFLNASYGQRLARDEELLHVLAGRRSNGDDHASSRAPKPLSPREVEVLWLLCTGMSVEQISAELYLSTNTVKTHIRNLRGKLGVSSRAEAVGWAVETGVYDPGTGRIDPVVAARLQGRGAERQGPAARWRRASRPPPGRTLRGRKRGARTTAM